MYYLRHQSPDLSAIKGTYHPLSHTLSESSQRRRQVLRNRRTLVAGVTIKWLTGSENIARVISFGDMEGCVTKDKRVGLCYFMVFEI